MSTLKEFNGGKRIIQTVSTATVYDDISDEFWPGKIGTCISVTDVSPNALRYGTGKTKYRICDNTNPVPGNLNHNITRYFGWRGTTSDLSVYAHGVRMVEKIVQFKNHARIYISRYNKEYQD